MTRITIEVRDDVAESFPPRPRLSIIGIGASGQTGGSVAEGHKEFRRAHLADKTASDV